MFVVYPICSFLWEKFAFGHGNVRDVIRECGSIVVEEVQEEGTERSGFQRVKDKLLWSFCWIKLSRKEYTR